MRFRAGALLQLGVFIMLVLTTPRAGRGDSLPEKVNTETLSVELGLDVASGKYGGGVSTTTVSVPLSILYLPTERLDLGLSVPFIRQSNGLVVAGRVVRPTAVRPAPTARPVTTGGAVSGIGDLVLAAGYLLHAETESLPQLRPVVSVKAPTADSSLGSGEFDETVGLGLGKSLDNWYLFLDAGYTVQGRTVLFSARNFVDYDAGIGYEIVPGLRPSLGVKGASSAQTGEGGVTQAEAKLVYAASRALDLKLNLERGLSVASPDWEAGCSLAYNF